MVVSPITSRAAGRSLLRGGSLLAGMALMAGCAAFPTLSTSVREPRGSTLTEAAAPQVGDDPARASSERLRIPAAGGGRQTRPPASAEQIAALVPDDPIEAALTPQPVGEFVATVFGQLIDVPYSLAPEVAGRTDLISGGTGGPTSKRELFRIAQVALRQYGLDVFIENGVAIIGQSESGAASGGLIRGRTTPSTGGNIVQIFPVQTIEVNVLQQLLQDIFPGAAQARITPDQLSNSLIISGSSRDVVTVTRLLRQLDQPRFAGAEVLRVEPVYWGADALTQSLEQVLTAEGYVVSRQALARRSIVILPFAAANQILIFADDEEVLSRVQYWVSTLDQPAALGDRTSTFVYQVRNIDAQSIGQLAMGQTPSGTAAPRPVGVPGAPPANEATQRTPEASTPIGGAGGQFLGGRIIVDSVGNRVIFTGTAADFAQLRTLLNTLDVPAPQGVVEVIIAEVTLTDSTDIGLEFFGTDVDGDETISGGTEGGIGVQAGGLTVNFTGPDLRARFSASASNSKVNVLSRPRLVARSGGQARFQVGTDVPIITSQAASNNQNNGDTDILQSIQYRQTGVILEVEPVVYGDRVDITISQEISEVGDAVAGIDSPTILNRSLTTQMSINDGWTGVLGGLISNSYTKGNSGVPFLKDIPLVGSAFQSNSVGGTRTELLLLITPTIVRGDEDMRALAELYTQDMNAAFRVGRGWSYTLTPFNLGPVRGFGFDLPSGEPESERPPLFRRPSANAAGEAMDPQDPAPVEQPPRP